MAKQNLFILTALLALTALVGCEEKDWSRGEYLLASDKADEKGTYNPQVNIAEGGTYSLYVDANVEYTMKFETASTVKDWLTLEGKRHDAATGKDIITFTVKDQEGAPFRRTGTISLMAPEKYLNNFVQVNQGFASRSGSNFSFLQYGSANPLEGLGGRLISLWTEAQADEGWSSTKGPGLDEAYCYGRNGFIQLGDDASHGADLISPYNSNFFRDTVLLVYFDAVAYADKDGVKDDVTLTVEVTGGGEFSDGSKVKTVKVPNLDPNAEELAKSMWTNVGNRFYVVSKPGNMLSSSTRIRVMDGEYTNASPSRVFIDNFYLFTINREHWDNLIGGLAWVDQLEKDK